MTVYRVLIEVEVEADSPEDAAVTLRDRLKAGESVTAFVVDVPDGKVVIDTEEGGETVIRDDRKQIGPVIMRQSGPTGVLTSPILAAFYGHDKMKCVTHIEHVDGNQLRLYGVGAEAYFTWSYKDGSTSPAFAVITVHRSFASQPKQIFSFHSPAAHVTEH